jgi:superfamily II DNA or RNA helicase
MGSSRPASQPGFPESFSFRKTWRAYQSRLLEKLDEYASDGSIHFVAAPGSGKTVLGLEVIRRLNQPTLVLAPTLTIRDQWLDRLSDGFLPPGEDKSRWTSKDIRHPALLTVTTFQALHSICSGEAEDEDRPSEEETVPGPANGEQESNGSIKKASVFPACVADAGFRTLVVDEAHHLRAEWWKTLTFVRDQLHDPTILALTATPPYDVTPFEWQRYEEFCGPVDAEVPVPELVRAGDLCPHQDYVYFSIPDAREQQALSTFRKSVEDFTAQLKTNAIFAEAIARHPWLTSPDDHVEDILEDPEYLSSMIVFLNARASDVPPSALNILGLGKTDIPRLDLTWLEILLTHCLYSDTESFQLYQQLFRTLRHDLLGIGAIERRKVKLVYPSDHLKLLTTSVSKLNSIEQIVRLESQSLKDGLRCVVLTDFIRKSELPATADGQPIFEDIGIVPIFETLRRADLPWTRLGVLSGSLVVVPADVQTEVMQVAASLGIQDRDLQFSPLVHTDKFVALDLRGEHYQGMVRLLTALFRRGTINVLVGTKSLLGEGWDAPCINTLILATFVGSYVLSNQMRGRAIRVDPDFPDKTANIWHLVCIEPGLFGPGEDFQLLARRCSAFVGVSATAAIIENGTARLGFDKPPSTSQHVQADNERTCLGALDRAGLAQRWKTAILSGSTLTEGVKAPAETAPRGFVFANTIAAIFFQAAFLFMYVLYSMQRAMYRLHTAMVAFAVAAIVSLPWALVGLWRLIRHGTPERSIWSIGRTLLRTLQDAGLLDDSLSEFRVYTDHNSGDGSVYCWLGGGTAIERATFLRGMREILGPIDNPRYLLARTRFWRFFREDYFAVPESIGRKKEFAEAFARRWRRSAGPVELVYTRTPEGRRTLLRARTHSLSSAFQNRTERVSSWR